MTAIVGVLCSDGVVIGADSSATSGSSVGPLIEQETKKIDIIEDRFIFAGTGEAGLHQRFHYIVSENWKRSAFRNQHQIPLARDLCNLGINDFAKTAVQGNQYGALAAFPAQGTFHLCEFAYNNFHPEFKTPINWFVSMGSGQTITDPFLALLKRVFWDRTQPTVREGIFAACWTLNHVIKINPGGINGPQHIAVLEKDASRDLKARFIHDDEMAEHLNSAEGAEAHLRRYRDILLGSNEPEAPRVSVPAIPPAHASEPPLR